MSSMLATIAPKSDQLNFDDFTGNQTKTIKITSVDVGKGDQPVSLHYEGDNGKPWKPCKSMRRVLVRCWGPNSIDYAGKSVTLFGDPSVRFGGADVGGIRVSHISHIDEPITMALTATRAQRKPYTVKPLAESNAKPIDLTPFDAAIKKVAECLTDESLSAAIEESRALKGWPKAKGEEMKKVIESTKANRAKVL